MASFITEVVVVVVPIGLVLWLLAPRSLALLLWPVILLYPAGMLHGILPMNAGFDDVLILAVAVRVLFYQHPCAASRWAMPVALLACGMAGMQLIAECTGLANYPETRDLVLKSSLKGIVFIAFAFVMAKTIRSARDVRLHLVVFLLSLSLSFLIVLLCNLSPNLSSIWEDYGSEERYRALEYMQGTAQMRSFGTFNTGAAVGTIIAAAVPLGLGLLARRDWLLQPLSAFMLSCASIALAVAKTRSTLIGLALVGLGCLILSRWRWRILTGMLVVTGAACVLFATTDYGKWLGDRLETERVSEDFATRFDIWRELITNPSLAILFFGEGGPATELRVGVMPHNGFLDTFLLWGIGGVAMFVVLYRYLVVWSLRVARCDRDASGSGTAWGALWGAVATWGAALSLDPWYVNEYRFFVYFVLAIVWQRYSEVRAVAPLVVRKDISVARRPVLAATSSILNPLIPLKRRP